MTVIYDVYVTGDGSPITAFENTGSDTAPIWQANPAWDFQPSGMSQIFWAEFVDINGDGKPDLSVAKYDTIKFYKNTGDTLFAWTRMPSWDLAIPDANLRCSFGDLDGDGDYDIILREWSTQVRAFENIGSDTNPAWQEKSAWAPPSSVMYSALGDLDGDGDLDLLGEGNWPTSTAFENTGTINNPVWTERAGWDIDSAWYAGLVNIDGDGVGGCVEGRKDFVPTSIAISPNPFTKKARVKYYLPAKSQVTIKIYDVTGKLIKVIIDKEKEPGHYIANWYAMECPPGIHFLRFNAGNYNGTEKLAKID